MINLNPRLHMADRSAGNPSGCAATDLSTGGKADTVTRCAVFVSSALCLPAAGSGRVASL